MLLLLSSMHNYMKTVRPCVFQIMSCRGDDTHLYNWGCGKVKEECAHLVGGAPAVGAGVVRLTGANRCAALNATTVHHLHTDKRKFRVEEATPNLSGFLVYICCSCATKLPLQSTSGATRISLGFILGG